MLSVRAPALAVVLLAAALLAPTGDAQAGYPDGFYLSVGLGYAHVIGERGLAFQQQSCLYTVGSGDHLWREDGRECWTDSGWANTYSPSGVTADQVHSELARTDFGSGMGFELTLGYNILGYVSPEISIVGNGDPAVEDGAAHIGFVVRYHPTQHFIDHDDRDWDANVFFGAGYSIGGYHPDQAIQGTDDGKGWEGYHFTLGAGFDYAVAEFLSVGLDMHFILPRWESWIVNFDNDVRSKPVDTPMTLIVAPLVHAKFHP